LFAEILNRHADKIIIRDPRFQIPPFWKRLGGFDHEKTNPTAALVVAIDTEGTIAASRRRAQLLSLLRPLPCTHSNLPFGVPAVGIAARDSKTNGWLAAAWIEHGHPEIVSSLR